MIILLWIYLLQLILNKVLLVGSSSQTIVGRPTVPSAVVQAVVEEHVRVTAKLFTRFLLLMQYIVRINFCWRVFSWTVTIHFQFSTSLCDLESF